LFQLHTAQGDLIFYVGRGVKAARVAGFLVTGGLSAVVGGGGWGGNRLGELRVRCGDPVTKAELCALFHK